MYSFSFQAWCRPLIPQEPSWDLEFKQSPPAYISIKAQEAFIFELWPLILLKYNIQSYKKSRRLHIFRSVKIVWAISWNNSTLICLCFVGILGDGEHVKEMETRISLSLSLSLSLRSQVWGNPALAVVLCLIKIIVAFQ